MTGAAGLLNIVHFGIPMPRRKYGHMVTKIGNVSKDKCPLCRANKPCPVHKKND